MTAATIRMKKNVVSSGSKHLILQKGCLCRKCMNIWWLINIEADIVSTYCMFRFVAFYLLFLLFFHFNVKGNMYKIVLAFVSYTHFNVSERFDSPFSAVLTSFLGTSCL